MYLCDDAIRSTDAATLLMVALDKEPPGDGHHLPTATDHHLNVPHISHTQAVLVVLLPDVAHCTCCTDLLTCGLQLAANTNNTNIKSYNHEDFGEKKPTTLYRIS